MFCFSMIGSARSRTGSALACAALSRRCWRRNLCEALSRPRYGRRKSGEDAAASVVGVRHGHRERTLTGTFGKTRIAVPRARLMGDDGETREWRSGSLRAYQRRTRAADALIAGAYLSGTNTRRVRRALAAAFAGPVGKDVVSRTWRKVKGDWDAGNGRSLDDLVRRGLPRPELVVVDGAPGLEKALAALWPDMAIQRCTVHKHRNLLAHAPERLHEEISNDYKDMIYAQTKPEVEARRKAFIRKWRLKCRAVADSLEEAGDKLFTFTRFPPSQWKSIRTSNAIERLHEEFKRRIKTQTVLPCAETAAMLFWALLASGQITIRKVDGWQTLAEKPADQIIDLAA